jgi:RNA polymerase sigma-70 factor (ECF subfamily)
MDDTLRLSEETILLKRGIAQLNAGDPSVRGELLNIACARLMRLTSRLRSDFAGFFPEDHEGRSTEDIFHHASLRLYQALHDTPIRDVRHFYRLAATEIRRELIDLCRHCQRLNETAPAGEDQLDDAGNRSERISIAELRRWIVLHDSVEALPESEREVFELIWYHEMTRGEAAELLGQPVVEVRRLWRSARLNLHELLGGDGLSSVSAGN